MPREARAPVAVLGLGLFALYLWHGLSRLSTLHHETYDLALYTRLAWGLAGGDGWVPIRDTNFVAAHASVALLPLGLLGRVFGTAQVLLGAQAACLAAAVVPLARIGARRFGVGGAIAAALLWMLYPNLGHVAAYEFHPGSLAMLPLCWALDALDRRDARALSIAVLCVLGCRADYALITAMLGVVALAAGADAGLRTVGRRIALGSALYFGVVVLGLPRLFDDGVSSAQLHFGHWGGSPLGVVPALLSRPLQVWQHFTAPARLLYPLKVLSPLLLLPLLRPRLLLIAAPPLALNLLSEFPTTLRFYSHYLTPALPALIYAALDAAAGLPARGRGPAIGGCVVAAGIFSVVAGGHPWSRDYPSQDFVADGRTTARRALIDHVPAGASVQAPDPLLPHLAERRIVHRAPPPERGTHYVVLDLAHRQRYGGDATLLRTQQEPIVQRWVARADHGVVYANDALLLLRRGADPRGAAAARYFVTDGPRSGGIALSACLSVATGRLEADKLELRLLAHGRCPADLALRIGTADRPDYVQLPFDGVLSPVHLRAGDVLRSTHTLPDSVAAAIRVGALRVGAIRTSGAPPDKGDPVSVAVPR